MSTENEFQVGWIANLSDGSTVYEKKAVEGERTPWQQLLERCRHETHEITKTVEENGKQVVVKETVPLQIKMLRLQYGRITIMAMPNQMCDGYFQAREVHRIVYRDKYIHKHGIGSVIGNQVFINWLEITSDGRFYIQNDIRPLESCKVHTTVD